MPIMAAHGQNDARVAARLLASTAVDCLRDPVIAANWQVALNNVYRLLEAFKLNPFFGLEAPARKNSHAVETLAFVQPMERHIREVQAAIDEAIVETFSGQSREQAIEEVENILRGIAYPQDFDRPSQEQLGKAKDFFEKIIDRLKLA